MNLPEEYTDRIKEQLGSEFSSFMKTMEEPAQKALRLNRRRIAPADFIEIFQKVSKSEKPEEVSGIPGAFYYTDALPGKSAFHEAGALYIQEPSAMIPVTLLDAEGSDLTILDLCAAPGGKTTQIADCMRGAGLLVANEIIPSRALILSENLERMGVTNALVINEDPTALAGRSERFFDKILVDAPCSGEGMFRKNPEAVNEWSPENVAVCASRQDMILDCAAKMLKDGGRIVYSTCTFSPEEDEGTVERFLTRHPGFSAGKIHRIWPHKWRGEGHFAAVLTKDGSPAHEDDPVQVRRSTVKMARDDAQLFETFIRETLKESCTIRQSITDDPHRIITFGDSIYLAPERMPDIKGLKVLRAGLKLGCLKKNRFEPDHALSHALTPDDVNMCLDLDADDPRTLRYLAGETTECEKDLKGWCLICVEGFAMGWGKAVGGIIKNHYPKGLRRQVLR